MQDAYTNEELIQHGQKAMFGEGNARLPINEMLMVERILKITKDGGKYGRGQILAELDIHKDLWFFKCHFVSDPVMPGCLGLDALWQLLGFYLAWSGGQGLGRALGCGEVKFSGQITPSAKKISYQLDIKRIMNRGSMLGIADGVVILNDEVIYQAKNLRAGLFPATEL